MNMTPLHVLCSNPFATTDMIKQLTMKFPSHREGCSSKMKITPLDMFLMSETVISNNDCIELSIGKCVTSPNAVALVRLIPTYNLHEMIRLGLKYDVLNVISYFNGKELIDELYTNKEWGLYPFMTAAISPNCSVADLYRLVLSSKTVYEAK